MRIAQINTTYGSADSTGRNVKELHEFLNDYIIGQDEANQQQGRRKNIGHYSFF